MFTHSSFHSVFLLLLRTNTPTSDCRGTESSARKNGCCEILLHFIFTCRQTVALFSLGRLTAPPSTEVVENKSVQAFGGHPVVALPQTLFLCPSDRGDKGTKNVYPDCLSCAISTSCFSPAAHQQLFPTLCLRPFAVRSRTAQSSHRTVRETKRGFGLYVPRVAHWLPLKSSQ